MNPEPSAPNWEAVTPAPASPEEMRNASRALVFRLALNADWSAMASSTSGAGDSPASPLCRGVSERGGLIMSYIENF